MSRGDLILMKNALKQLELYIRYLKYKEDIDYEMISKGLPDPYLVILQFAFNDYSPSFSKHLNEKGLEISGKSGMRFLEGVFLILREIFSYKPKLTKDQFMKTGFALQKVLLLRDILQMIYEWNKREKSQTRKKILKSRENQDTNFTERINIKATLL